MQGKENPGDVIDSGENSGMMVNKSKSVSVVKKQTKTIDPFDKIKFSFLAFLVTRPSLHFGLRVIESLCILDFTKDLSYIVACSIV